MRACAQVAAAVAAAHVLATRRTSARHKQAAHNNNQAHDTSSRAGNKGLPSLRLRHTLSACCGCVQAVLVWEVQHPVHQTASPVPLTWPSPVKPPARMRVKMMQQVGTWHTTPKQLATHATCTPPNAVRCLAIVFSGGRRTQSCAQNGPSTPHTHTHTRETPHNSSLFNQIRLVWNWALHPKLAGSLNPCCTLAYDGHDCCCSTQLNTQASGTRLC